MSFLDQLHEFTTQVFKDEAITKDVDVRTSGNAVVVEIKSKGYAIRKEMADKQARSVFVQIQASSERIAVDEVAKTTTSDEVARKAYVQLQSATEKAITDRLHAVNTLGRMARSVWIIHTPTIATPCVTNGIPTPNLLAEDIMKDEARKNLTLSRATIIRDYLQAGGVLIVAYDSAHEGGRTPEQRDIYQKLIAQYPQQIIDFPIDINTKQAKLELATPDYPLDLIGATYLLEDTHHQTFEMTNLGVQANDPRLKDPDNNATWGVWMQNRSQPIPEVTQRMGVVFDFLQKAGLNQVLHNHAKQHNINTDEYARLLSRYMSLEIDPKKGVGCKIQ